MSRGKIYSITLFLLLVALAVSPLAHVAPALAEEVTIKTSRDAWGTVWKNTTFYVTVTSYTASGENITLLVTVGGEQYYVNATRIAGTPNFRANFTVDPAGNLVFTDASGNSQTIALTKGDTIKFSYGNVYTTLTYKHVSAGAEIRTTVPHEVEKVGTLDWVIKAPDLNKDPYNKDTIKANVTITNYATGDTKTLRNLVFKETGANTGEFKPVIPVYSVSGQSRSGTNIAFNSTVNLGTISQNNVDIGPIKVTFINQTNGNVTIVKIDWINNTSIGVDFNVTSEHNIPNIANNTATTLRYNITVPGTPITFAIEYNITITSNTTHYNVTIDHLNLTDNNFEEYIYAAAGVSIDVNQDADVKISVLQYRGATDTDEVTVPITVFTDVGKVEGTATLGDGLKITVTDKAANYKTYKEEQRTAMVYIPDTNTTGIPVTLTETEEDSGVFKGSLSILDSVNRSEINSSYNKIKIVYTDTNGVQRETTVGVTYHKAEIESTSPEKVVFGSSIVELKIKDADLNIDPNARLNYRITRSANDPAVFEVTPDKAGSSYTFKLAKIMLYAVLSNGTEVLLKVKSGETVTMTVTETGVDSDEFVVKVDLSKLEVTGLTAQTSAEKLKIVYEDEFTPDLKAENVTVEIPAAKPSLNVDREEIPLTTFKNGPIVHVTLVDPEANTNAYQKDTTSVGVYIVYTNGTTTSIGPASLTETDVNTGEFTGDITIPVSYIKPDLIGGKLLINHTTPDSGTYLEKTVPFALYPVTLKVNGTTSVVVKYGDTIEITVESKDFNLDASKAEKYKASDLGLTGVPSDLKFTETGNDTGVFKATLKIDGSFADPGETKTLKIKDETPTYATSGMTSWPDPETVTASVTVKAFTGELKVDKTESGPVGTITITVVDPDQNKNLDAKDKVDIWIQYWNGTFYQGGAVKATETDVSTGVFEYKLNVKSLGDASELIGNSIRIIYRDPATATGETQTMTATVTFKSWDPVISADKEYYKVGEKVKITVIDPDANKDPSAPDTVTVRVTSTSDVIGTTVTLTETGDNTGIFTGEVLLSEEIGTGRVYVKMGDAVTITYHDGYPADYGTTQKGKDFTKEVRVGVPTEKPVKPEKTEFINPMTGEKVTPKAGENIGIAVPLNNTGYMKTTFTVLLIVRDSTGAAVYIGSIQNLPLAPGETCTPTFTFTPAKPGDYTIEVYVIKGLSDWTPLGETLKTTMSVSE